MTSNRRFRLTASPWSLSAYRGGVAGSQAGVGSGYYAAGADATAAGDLALQAAVAGALARAGYRGVQVIQMNTPNGSA